MGKSRFHTNRRNTGTVGAHERACFCSGTLRRGFLTALCTLGAADLVFAREQNFVGAAPNLNLVTDC